VGVFTTKTIAMLGVIIRRRLGWVDGDAGAGDAILIIFSPRSRL